MGSAISILGCSPTGIQTAVYLLEQSYGKILIFDDSNDSYAQGMALDCMQASAIRGWQGTLVAVDNTQLLSQSDILIVSENLENTLPKDWITLAKSMPRIVYAAKSPDGIAQAIKEGVAAQSILGVHGLVDSNILAKIVADLLNISIFDVQVMICGGVGSTMQSTPELVRVHGIPVNSIQEGVFEQALSIAQSKSAYDDEPWGPHYTLAAAAAEIALILNSDNSMILPITREEGTVPCMIGSDGIQHEYTEIRSRK